MKKHTVLFVMAVMLALSACKQPSSTEPPPNAPVVSGGVVLPRGLLPESEFVPLRQPERYYPEVTTGLIPGDDYGRIWPYPASGSFMSRALYGLCDEEGRVICDPYYNEVLLIEKDGESLLMLIKNGRDEQGRKSMLYTLAAPDGSWVKEYEDVQYNHDGVEVSSDGMRIFHWRLSVDYDYITVKYGGKWGVIDYQGNEVLPCVYSKPVCFSEGLAAVLADDATTYSFVDTTGAMVLGPYRCSPPRQDPFDYLEQLSAVDGLLFCDGMARFYSDGKYGVIDHAGNTIIPAQYDFITLYSQGMAQFLSDDATGIIDTEGTVLLEPTAEWFDLEEDGTVFLPEQTGLESFNPKTGEHKPRQSMLYTSYESGVLVEWGSDRLRIPGANSVAALGNGNLAVTYTGEKSTWKIVDRGGKVVAGPFDGMANYSRDGFIYVYFVEPDSTYLRTLYDETGRRVLPEDYTEIAQFGSRFLVRQKNVAGLLDEDGQWIIKIPIYDYLSD